MNPDDVYLPDALAPVVAAFNAAAKHAERGICIGDLTAADLGAVLTVVDDEGFPHTGRLVKVHHERVIVSMPRTAVLLTTDGEDRFYRWFNPDTECEVRR